MSLTIRFLGTAASRPTIERNVSALALVREGETLLFDCGEGTQRQMMRYAITLEVDGVFLTHLHADHYLGVAGLVRTLGLQGRTAPLRVWGPRGAARVLRRADALGGERLGFDVEVAELGDGEAVERGDYRVQAFAVDHRGVSAVGWRVAEHDRLGRFNPDLARELGIPEGPMWGQLHRGRAVTLDDGRTITPDTLVGRPRPGRTVVYTGDTRPCDATRDAARGADLLVHEATFADEEASRAVETGHSTAREAARIAREAGATRLALTHLSARYSRDVTDLEREARAEFAAAIVARDGTQIDLPYREA